MVESRTTLKFAVRLRTNSYDSVSRMIRAIVLFTLAPLSFAQTNLKVPPDVKFEVASIRPGDPNSQRAGIRPAPGGERYVAEAATLKMMLTVAYRIRAEQITGGPDWINTDRFDMNAKAEKPANIEDLHRMLVNLLIERFQLKFHLDKKEMPMYALTVDKNGPKLTPHASSNAGEAWIDQGQTQFLHVTMKATSCPMDYFAFRLSTILDRPVVDLTGIKGEYDFDFNFTRELPPNIPEGAQVNGAPIDTSGPNVFAAMKALGLELKAQKGPVDVIVIDSATKLAAN